MMLRQLGAIVLLVAAVSATRRDRDDVEVLTDTCEGNTQTYRSKCECNCDCPDADDVCPDSQTCGRYGCTDGGCLRCVVCDSAANETECNAIGFEKECCAEQEMCMGYYVKDGDTISHFERRCARRDECPTSMDNRWQNANGTHYCHKASCNPWGCASYINRDSWTPHCSNDITQNPKVYVPYKAGDYTQGSCRCDAWCWEENGGGGSCDCCPDYFDMNCYMPSTDYGDCMAETARGRGINGKQILDDEIY